jgi:hypothetical protein
VSSVDTVNQHVPTISMFKKFPCCGSGSELLALSGKIISDPDPGSTGSEMNTKLIKFTISKQNAQQKNLSFQTKFP